VAGSSWLADALACVMIATAAYCVSRLVISWRGQRPTHRDVDAVHVLMGVAMAGMLVPRLRVFWVGGWEVVFGAAAAWFGWQATRRLGRRPAAGRTHGDHAQHLLACLAMLYMLLAVTSAGAAADGHGSSSLASMPGGSAHLPTLALVFALALFGYVVWTADQLSSRTQMAVAAGREQVPELAGRDGHYAGGSAPAERPGHRGTGPAPAGQDGPAPLSPRLAACCEIAMGVTMGYMLIMML
jgi:hypothetical protein